MAYTNNVRDRSSGSGDRPLNLDDIKKDAEKVRPYDSLYDMYYDEFEDAGVLT